MARRQSKAQRETVERVMHEYKHGQLPRGRGGKVKSRRQAVAIALHEAGASKYESPKENRRNLARTKRRERSGATGTASKRGGSRRASGGRTREKLYQEARRRNIRGRSKMNKSQLERALRR